MFKETVAFSTDLSCVISLSGVNVHVYDNQDDEENIAVFLISSVKDSA